VETERLANQVLAIAPDNADALLLLGVARTKMGRFEEAQEPLEKASQDSSNAFYAYYWLSISLRKLGLPEAAMFSAEAAVAINRDDPMGLEQLGYCYLEVHRFRDAEASFRAAMIGFPKRAQIYGGLGLALRGQGRSNDAVNAFRSAVEIQPQSALAQTHLGQALADEGDLQGALVCARRVLKLRPDSVDAHLGMVTAHLAVDDPTEALKHLEAAKRMGPPSAKIYAVSGHLFLALGQLEKSRQEFEEALRLDPVNGEATLGIAQNRRVTDLDLPFVHSIELALSRADLPIGENGSLHYALGKSYEDLGRYEDAMAQFDQANRITRQLRFGDTPFDGERYIAENDIAIEVMSGLVTAQNRSEGSPKDLPIIVVGMIRSGTTLTEQILSRHPDVGGAGEQSFWQVKLREAFAPESLELISGEISRLADEYCALLQRIAPGKRHVVDKMPANYLVLPFIHLAMPNVRIIHMNRHPIDTCISIYSTPNSSRLDWSNERESIVLAYQEYRRMMRAWRNLIPSELLLDVRYEDLVSNPERVSREIVEFCGLEWNDACLRPEEGDRYVATPSRWQVRQPIYTSSTERWKRYEPWLGAFAGLMDDSSFG